MAWWEACYKNINLVSVAEITDSVYPRIRNMYIEVAAKWSPKIIRSKISTATGGIATDIYLYFQTPKVLLNWGRGDEERKTGKAAMACDFTHTSSLFIWPKGKHIWQHQTTLRIFLPFWLLRQVLLGPNVYHLSCSLARANSSHVHQYSYKSCQNVEVHTYSLVKIVLPPSP